jgi:hypothetical protein
MASKHQIITIQTLLSRLGIQGDDKLSLVHSFSDGATVSVKELDPFYADSLIAHLKQKQLQATQVKSVAHFPLGSGEGGDANKKRRKIFALCHQMDIHTTAQVQAFVTRHWKKGLNDYTGAELSSIISIIEQKLLPHYLKTKRQEP